MKKTDRTKINQQKSLAHIALSGGNILLACKNAGISRTQIYEWMKDPKYKTDYLETIKSIEKYAESMLLKKSLNGDIKATIVLLKNSQRKQNRMISI